MIPLGYMAKFVEKHPDWLKKGGVEEIFSVSSHISKDFCEWIDSWKHNGFWFFDNPGGIRDLAAEKQVDLSESTFFYYEAFEKEYVSETKEWRPFIPEPSFPLKVAVLKGLKLRGYDVATFSCGNSAECSPLSCNYMAEEIPVNQFCLLDSFDEAKLLLESGRFDNSEPGPYRIISVATLPENG